MTAHPRDEDLAAFVEHRLAQSAVVEAHIDTCDSCRAIVAHLAAMRIGESPDVTATARTEGVPPTIPTGAAVPARVGRYVIERELGRGGMGVVLLAHDPALDRRVALKLVRGRAGDAHARERLLREARAMAKLAHPNVVAVHDVSEEADGEIVVAMELVQGVTLRAALNQRTRTPADVVELFLQAGRGLAAAHAAGLVHRDFKPENVLVGADGRVRVTDFGLARSDAPDSATAPPLTGSGVVMGTPAYMAPEQHLGAKASDRADQYAFCIALFEALTGERPFVGSYEEIAAAKLDGRRRPWPTNAPASTELRAAIDRGLATSPLERHDSMNDLLATLERATRAAPPPRTERTPPPPMTAHTPAPLPYAPTLPVRASAPVPRGPAWAPPIAGPPPPKLSPAAFALGLALVAVVAIVAVPAIVDAVRKATVRASPEERAQPARIAFVPSVPDATTASALPCPAGAVQRNFHVAQGTDFETHACMRGDQHEGPTLLFYIGGALREQSVYRGDKRDGRSFVLDPEGTVDEVSDWTAGERNGVHARYGTKSVYTDEHWLHGKKPGVQRSWYGDGELSSWQRYENGVVVETKR